MELAVRLSELSANGAEGREVGAAPRSAFVKGFGCRPELDRSTRYRTGVRKPPKNEPAKATSEKRQRGADRTNEGRIAHRERMALGACRLAFDDQRIDDGEALPFGVDNDRVEIDLLDLLGVVGGEAR